jgi:hypothetical protein
MSLLEFVLIKYYNIGSPWERKKTSYHIRCAAGRLLYNIHIHTSRNTEI